MSYIQTNSFVKSSQQRFTTPVQPTHHHHDVQVVSQINDHHHHHSHNNQLSVENQAQGKQFMEKNQGALIVALTVEIERLTNDLTAEREKVKSLTFTSQNHNSLLYDEQIKELDLRLQTEVRANGPLRQENAKFKTENIHLREQIERLKEELVRAKEFEPTIYKLEREIELLKDQLRDKDNLIADLQGKLQRLDHIIHDQQIQIDSLPSLQRELDKLRQKVQDQDSQIHLWQDKYNDADRQLHKLDDIAHIQDEASRLDQKNHQLQHQVGDLEHQLQDEQQKTIEWQNKYNELEQKLHQLHSFEDQIHHLNDDLESWKLKCNDLERIRRELEHRIADLEAELKTDHQSIDRYEHNVSDLKDQIEKLKMTIEEQSHKYKDLTIQYHKLQEIASKYDQCVIEIANLQHKLDLNMSEILDLKNLVKDKNCVIEDLQAQLGKEITIDKKYELKIKDLEARIHELEHELSCAQTDLAEHHEDANVVEHVKRHGRGGHHHHGHGGTHHEEEEAAEEDHHRIHELEHEIQQLKSELHHKQDIIIQNETIIEEWRIKYEQIHPEIDRLNIEVQRLYGEIESRDKIIEDKQNQKERLFAILKAKEQELDRLERLQEEFSIEKYESEIQAHLRTIEDLKERLSLAQGGTQVVHHVEKVDTSHYESRIHELELIVTQYKSKEHESHHSRDEIIHLRSDISSLESTNNSLLAQISTLQREKQELLVTISALKNELEHLKHHHGSNDHEVHILKDEILMLKADLQRYKDQIHNLQNSGPSSHELNHLHETIARLESEIHTYKHTYISKSEYDKCKSEVHSLTLQINKYKTEIHQLQHSSSHDHEIAGYRDEIHHLKDKIAHLESDLHRLRHDNDGHQETVKRHKRDHGHQETTISSLNIQITNLSSTITSKEVLIKSLQEKIILLEKQVSSGGPQDEKIALLSVELERKSGQCIQYLKEIGELKVKAQKLVTVQAQYDQALQRIVFLSAALQLATSGKEPVQSPTQQHHHHHHVTTTTRVVESKPETISVAKVVEAKKHHHHQVVRSNVGSDQRSISPPQVVSLGSSKPHSHSNIVQHTIPSTHQHIPAGAKQVTTHHHHHQQLSKSGVQISAPVSQKSLGRSTQAYSQQTGQVISQVGVAQIIQPGIKGSQPHHHHVVQHTVPSGQQIVSGNSQSPINSSQL